jgi:hypothetical protein
MSLETAFSAGRPIGASKMPRLGAAIWSKFALSQRRAGLDCRSLEWWIFGLATGSRISPDERGVPLGCSMAEPGANLLAAGEL